MNKLRLVIAASTLALMSGSANAENEQGLYIAGFFGAGVPGDVNLTGTQAPEAGAP